MLRRSSIAFVPIFRLHNIGEFFAPAVIDVSGPPADAFTSSNGTFRTSPRTLEQARKGLSWTLDKEKPAERGVPLTFPQI